MPGHSREKGPGRRRPRKKLAVDSLKRMLILAANGKAVTGVALLMVLSLVGWSLLGEGLTGVAIPVARVVASP